VELTQTEKATIERARSAGTGGLVGTFDDETCAYLTAVIAKDLGLLRELPDSAAGVIDFFAPADRGAFRLAEAFFPLLERLVSRDRNVVTYFACLAKLHKARLKYSSILRTQPIPTLDQVGPRGLLQHGLVSPRGLAAFLLWRKWIYDLDNRAAQETGNLFEPIMAHALGGVAMSAAKSPVRRHDEPSKGRQVDCIRRRLAYEIKLRVTIAASGQGRWAEEMGFPLDCRASGYTPVLLVFDPTPNPKLSELVRAFEAQKGLAHVGAAAWAHLEKEAGKTMATFLDKYVRAPLDGLLREAPPAELLPSLALDMGSSWIRVRIGEESFSIPRSPGVDGSGPKDLPDDVEDEIPGP
jgi:hypothetical protein